MVIPVSTLSAVSGFYPNPFLEAPLALAFFGFGAEASLWLRSRSAARSPSLPRMVATLGKPPGTDCLSASVVALNSGVHRNLLFADLLTY